MAIQFSKKGSGQPQPLFLLTVAVVVLVLLAGVNSVYTVDQKQQAVVTRFGRYYATTEPGLHFKIPLLDRAYKVDTQVNFSLDFGFRTSRPGIETTFQRGDFSDESRMLTGDLNIIDLPFVIQYRITEPVKWLFGVENERISTAHGSIDNRIKTIRDVSTAVINRYVGNTSASNVQEGGRELIAEPARLEINQLLDSFNLGVSLLNINLNEVVYPAIVQEAIEDVNAAEQDRDRLINEGQGAYNKEIPRIRGEAERVIQQATGAVARFNAIYAEYIKDPEIFRQRYYYETMEMVMKNADNIQLIDRTLENFLPIQNLGRTGKETEK